MREIIDDINIRIFVYNDRIRKVSEKDRIKKFNQYDRKRQLIQNDRIRHVFQNYRTRQLIQNVKIRIYLFRMTGTEIYSKLLINGRIKNLLSMTGT
jgi:hypothetical protein